jgi:serine/threonine protein kinase
VILKNPTNAMQKQKQDMCRDAFMLLYNIWQKDPDVSKIVPEPIGFFENHRGLICEVHEFIGGGSLLDTIISNKHGWYDSKGNMKDHTAKSIFSQLLVIKKTLKKHDVTHRDLSPENFLVRHVQGQLPILYVIDFGHAKGMVDELHGICGKENYNSPELNVHVIVLEKLKELKKKLKEFEQQFVQKKDYSSKLNNVIEKYDHKTDNFSLGQVLYVVLTRRRPYYDEIRRAEVLKSVRNNIFVDIINGLLLQDPNDRWSAERALSYLNTCVDTKPEVASDPGLATHVISFGSMYDEAEVMEYEALSGSDLLNSDQC